MFRNPLSDKEAINQRGGIIEQFAKLKTRFLLKELCLIWLRNIYWQQMNKRTRHHIKRCSVKKKSIMG